MDPFEKRSYLNKEKVRALFFFGKHPGDNVRRVKFGGGV